MDESAPRGRMKRRGRSGLRGLFIVLLLLAVAAGVYIVAQAEAPRLLDPGFLSHRVGLPVLRSIAFIAVGLLVGQLIESLGLTARLGRLVWPLIRWARLPGEAGASFSAAFISGVLANTLLLTSWQEGKISRRGLILTNILNASLPAYVLHMPTTMFIILGLTGRAGAIYVGLTLSAAILRLVVTAVASRVIMPPCPACALDSDAPRRTWPEVFKDTWPKFRDRLLRVALIVVPVYLVVVTAAEAGFFTWLERSLAQAITVTAVPVKAMSVVIFSVAAEFTSGFAAAGALLASGDLAVRDAVLALLIGNIVATPVRALRHQLPSYMGIYTPGLGLMLLSVGQLVRVTSVLLVMIIFWFW